MPAITNSNATILVSGANGFIANWIVDDLLKKGYTVRAVVRTEAKGKHLMDMYKSYGGKLQLFLVDDMEKEGAFDEAVKDVDGILHTASPCYWSNGEPAEMIEPAVNGMLGILKSALKLGTSVRRIVVTSSCAAVLNYSPVLDDAWNDASVNECKEKGKDASSLAKYSASKTLAERAAWKFYEDHKSEINWDICALNPAWVVGPVIHKVTTVDDLGSSTKMFYDAVVHEKFSESGGGADPLISPTGGWVDVRDVSKAHILALETPVAGGERMIISAGMHKWQDWFDVANSFSPSPYPSHTLPKGTPGVVARSVNFDSSKIMKILGIKFRTMEESLRDVLADYERRGW